MASITIDVMMFWFLLPYSCGHFECDPSFADVVGDDIDQNCDNIDGIDQDRDGQASLASGGTDCDDDNPAIYAKQWYFDQDRDGFGSDPLWICNPSEGFVDNDGDCDDSNAEIHPNAVEICDSIDNDCDNAIDMADPSLDKSQLIRVYLDSDGDGVGTENEGSQLQCTLEEGWSLSNQDCDDSNAEAFPQGGDCGTCWFGDCDAELSLNPSTFINLIHVGQGDYLIGAPDNEPTVEFDERQRAVTLSYDFAIMSTLVTQGMYEAVMEANPAVFGPNSDMTSVPCGDTCPMENITWHEAALFANGITDFWNQQRNDQLEHCYLCESGTCQSTSSVCTGFRLPTETEWEIAIRANSLDAFWTQEGNGTLSEGYASNGGCGREWTLGDGAILEDYGWFCANNIGNFDDPFYGPKPVALKLPNGFGIFDGIGSLWEMTNDGYEENPPQGLDPYAEITDSVVRKGGMWGDPPSDLRAARRESLSTTYHNGDVGFRLMRRL